MEERRGERSSGFEQRLTYSAGGRFVTLHASRFIEGMLTDVMI